MPAYFRRPIMQPVTPSYTVINSAAAATIAIAAAVTGKKHYLLGIFVIAAGDTTVQLLSTATALTGAISINTDTGFVLPPGGKVAPIPWVETAEGGALNLVNSAAIQISGVAIYCTD